MRLQWVGHAPTLATFMAMVLLAGTMGLALEPWAAAPTRRIGALPAEAIPLPGPGEDADGDGYGDTDDLWVGNRMVRLTITRLDTGLNTARPYLLVGTQDDHWRFGEGRELEWLHVVDPDPLGFDPGSPAWSEASLRTGIWQRAVPHPDEERAIAEAPRLAAPDVAAGVTWPAEFMIDVREDTPDVTIQVELWDDRRGADRRLGLWGLELAADGNWSFGQVQVEAGDEGLLPGSRGAFLIARLAWADDLGLDLKQDVADRWSPRLHFAADETFYPTSGDTLRRFHGFGRAEPDLRTWTRSFDNGRDDYRLFVADVNGDRATDYLDVQLLTDILRAGAEAPDTIHAHVALAGGERIVVQYWFLYMYNFVLDETGRGVEFLAHAGDREFIQLEFRDVEAALNGTPERIAFSQHYGGIRIDAPDMDEAPFHGGTHPEVYVARGSHASFPVAGDDSRVRPSLVGYGDVFPGDGEVWNATTAEVVLLQDQAWHIGYLWGPLTRHHRDFGSSTRPILQHGFMYAYQEPLYWSSQLQAVLQEDLRDIYRTPEEA